MNEASWEKTKEQVRMRARLCCEYCGTHQVNHGFPLQIDHIVPGAGNNPENLAASCSRCNQSKYTFTAGVDPETGQSVRLFNPRLDNWQLHFDWADDFSLVVGLTAIGRATVIRLRMNDITTVEARKIWRFGGNHPPPFFDWSTSER